MWVLMNPLRPLHVRCLRIAAIGSDGTLRVGYVTQEAAEQQRTRGSVCVGLIRGLIPLMCRLLLQRRGIVRTC